MPHFDEYAYLRLSKKNEKGYHLENQTKLSFNKKVVNDDFESSYHYRSVWLLLMVNPNFDNKELK